MENNTINLIEPTPEPQSTLCKIAVTLIDYALRFGSLIIALIVWYRYDYFYGGAALLISYLLIGIVRSKLRTMSIPFSQLEYDYSDKAIAKWFVYRHFLCK